MGIDSGNTINASGEIVDKNAAEAPVTPPNHEVNIDTAIGNIVEASCNFLGLEPKEVYVPGSGTDVIPPLPALQNSHIEYADLDPRSVKTLQGAGYDAQVCDVETTRPAKPIDLLILNGISVDLPLDSVVNDGFVISDGRMNSAQNIATNHQNFDLVGVVVNSEPSTESGLSVDQSNLGYYLKQLRATEEENLQSRRNLLARLSDPVLAEPTASLPIAHGYIFKKSSTVEAAAPQAALLP